MVRRSCVVIPLALLAVGLPAAAHRLGAVGQGQHLAEARCASCHAIGPAGDSPDPRAPRFRDIAGSYEEHSLQKKLTEIDETGHYDMPSLRVHSNEISALIAYFNRLHRRSPGT